MTSRNQKLLVLAACAVLMALAWGLWQRPSMAFWRTHETAPALILSGNIEAHESVLSFKSVQSRITELPFHEGQSVHKGDVLAVLDSADYQQQLAIAQSNLALLQRQLDAARQNLETTGRTLLVDEAEIRQRQLDRQRALDLQQQGFASKAALDQTETALKQASAVLQRDLSVQTAAARGVDVAQAGVRNGEAAVALARVTPR